jgi:glycosyltransferase involved in cell wall biosynthesis
MSKKLKITFLMPRTGEWPSGGFRVIYQYANCLARLGHSVTLAHPGRMVINPTWLDGLKNLARYVVKKANGRYTPAPWLKMEPAVRMTCVPSLSARFLPDADVLVATAWQTAELTPQYPPAKGRGYYLIQHLETWNGPDDRVYATWKLPLRKIAVSNWLVEIANKMGESAVWIPSGLDIDKFGIDAPTENRRPNQLMMLYHNAKWKGCDDGIEALRLVRERDPEAGAILFGVPPRPATLPDWIEYHQSPSAALLRELYNRAAIFVAPSTTEGWGLTGCEALLCGAALVATDIDGHREFAFHMRTALTCPSRSPRGLADNILKLIENPELRIQLARNGNEFVRQFTWERAASSFESELLAERPVAQSAKELAPAT